MVDKDGWQRWLTKMVCERGCVTKLCVKDGVWQSCVWKWFCVKEGVWQSCVWGGGPGYRIKNKNPTQRCGERTRTPHKDVPILPRRTQVDVSKCHACHAKRRWMWPSATPATRNEGGRQVPRLPRETKVDAAKCLPQKVQRRHRQPKRAQARHQSQPSAISATPATQSGGGCRQVPRLPRKVPRRHRRPKRAQARHQSQPSAISATPATQSGGGCRQVPRLPRETKVDAAKCHACHAKCRGVTGDQNGPKRATRASPVPQVPRLPRAN